MSRVALPWLWASLSLHAGLLGFFGDQSGGQRLPLVLREQQEGLELLAEAPGLGEEPQRPVTESLPVTAPARTARERSVKRASASRGLEPRAARGGESSTEPVASSEPQALEASAESAAAPSVGVEAPLAEASGASGAPATAGESRGPTAPASGAEGAAVAASAALAEDLAATRRRYLRALRERVLARREYPHAAQRAGLQGTVCLRFSVNASGRLSALSVTCGEAAPEPLLQAALRAVRAAEPFGPLPSGLGSEVTVDLPVVFRLDAL
ncbi:MAG: TonB family protein [Deltaproteobacteria bacterium]